ncbi:hypothetical protein WJX81_004258 [Elliptochloris bilobata]|uniref:Uncharacterized protein n=1 Tax=Elliptochloris bilobata TaxID=381761 RepID=A0AAW1R182_9CHLO
MAAIDGVLRLGRVKRLITAQARSFPGAYRDQPPPQELWEDLFENPQQWWDYRHGQKRTPRSPDFRHRTKYHVLWADSRKLESGAHEAYAERLRALDAAPDGAPKPLPYPSQEELWSDLFAHPWLYKRSKGQRAGNNAPDFRCVRSNAGLWRGSAPAWVQERWEEVEALGVGEKPAVIEGTSPSKPPPPRQEQPQGEPKWTQEHAARAADALEGAYSPDFEAEDAPPEGSMVGGLYRHQMRALAFMLHRERPESGGPMGGILADDQGLGKTDRREPMCSADSETEDDDASASEPLRQGGTLVVMPKSIMSQWAQELHDKVAPEWRLHVLAYRDAVRARHRNEPETLAGYDVVLCTYGCLVWDSPLKGEPRGLFNVAWRRIVLDEAQQIRTHDTQTAVACSLLQGHFRWAVSGTPIQNSPEELFSVLHFLRYAPFDSLAAWRVLLREATLLQNPAAGVALLRAILAPIMLRRTKSSLIDGRPIVPLPPRLLRACAVEMSNQERRAYEQLEAEGEESLEGGGPAESMILIQRLQRLRRFCNHPALAARVLQAEGTCGECGGGQRQCAALACGHLICEACCAAQGGELWAAQSDGEESLWCSTCRAYSVPELAGASSAPGSGSLPPSAKVSRALEIVRDVCDEGAKVIVFSVWTGSLDLVGAALAAQGVPFCRLDGSMSAARRGEELDRFCSVPDMHVMLFSLRAGSTGLNLTVASRVVLLEPYWNPYVEDQAIDRAHRIGQEQEVHVFKLFVPGTVEERIMALQRWKRKLIERVPGEGPGLTW